MNNVKQALIIIIILIQFIVSMLFAEEHIKFNLINEGKLPQHFNRAEYKALDIFGNNTNYFITITNNFLIIYRFINNEMILFKKINISNSINESRQIWTVGDLNNNSKDEIIICKDRSIFLYEFENNQLIQKEYSYKDSIHSIIVGDINNDNNNELVLFTQKKHSGDDINEPLQYNLSLNIAKIMDDEILTMWSDKYQYGYFDTGIIPPPKLICISNIKNKKYNNLFISKPQSDVRATVYKTYRWENTQLIKDNNFIIEYSRTNDKIKSSSLKFEPNVMSKYENYYIVGYLEPIIIKNEVLFFASVGFFLHNKKGFRMHKGFFKVANNNVKILSKTFSTSDKLFFLKSDNIYSNNLILLLDRNCNFKIFELE